MLIPEARKLGVKSILITHATELGATNSQMSQMAESGAIIECVWMPQVKNKDQGG